MSNPSRVIKNTPDLDVQPFLAVRLDAPPLPELAGGNGDAPVAPSYRHLALERQAQALLDEARATAERILSEAEERAGALLDEAVAGSERIAEEARQAGYQAGYNQGLEDARSLAADEMRQARAEVEELRRQAHQERDELRTAAIQERHELIQETGADLLRLAMAVAARVVRSELTMQPEAIVRMVAAGLAKLQDAKPVVRVRPDDLYQVEERRDELAACSPGSPTPQFEADASLEQGEFVIYGEQGFIDGRTARQIGELERAILAALEQAEG